VPVVTSGILDVTCMCHQLTSYFFEKGKFALEEELRQSYRLIDLLKREKLYVVSLFVGRWRSSSFPGNYRFLLYKLLEHEGYNPDSGTESEGDSYSSSSENVSEYSSDAAEEVPQNKNKSPFKEKAKSKSKASSRLPLVLHIRTLTCPLKKRQKRMCRVSSALSFKLSSTFFLAHLQRRTTQVSALPLLRTGLAKAKH